MFGNLGFVLSFLLHFIKRLSYELSKLVFRKRRCEDLNCSKLSPDIGNSIKKNVCKIDHYILQDKSTEFLFKLGLFNINGDAKLNGKVVGLTNIEETRHTYYYRKSDICIMTEFEARELNLHYNGIARLLNLSPAFLISVIFKNVKVLIEFKIYPFDRITLYLNDFVIDELKLNASVSGLNVISWMIGLIGNSILRVMSFPIQCCIEFQTKFYLNKSFSKFYFTEKYVMEMVSKDILNTWTELEPFFKVEFETAREMSQKLKFGPTSSFYNLMTGLLKFKTDFNKVLLAKVLKDFLSKDYLSNATLCSEAFESDISCVLTSKSNSSSVTSDWSDSSSVTSDKSDSSSVNSGESDFSSVTGGESDFSSVASGESDSNSGNGGESDSSSVTSSESNCSSVTSSESDRISVTSRESDCSSVTSGKSDSVFGTSGLWRETIGENENSSETELDSIFKNEYNKESVSTFSESSSENEIVHYPETDSHDESNLQLENSYDGDESLSDNNSCEDNLQLQESYNKCDSQCDSDLCGESSFQFEETSNIVILNLQTTLMLKMEFNLMNDQYNTQPTKKP